LPKAMRDAILARQAGEPMRRPTVGEALDRLSVNQPHKGYYGS
jgi:hypothetical protein